MRQDIKGFNDHPDLFKLRGYVMGAPDHIWTGRLDYQAWGTSSNLFAISQTPKPRKNGVLVYSARLYINQTSGPAFDKEPIGGIFEITPAKSKNGLPSFLCANKVR